MRRRQPGRRVALLVGALVAVLGAGATPAYPQPVAGSSGGWGTVDSLPTTPNGLQLGVQFNGMWSHYTDAQRDQVLDTLADAGAGWVRIDVSWAMLQPKPDQFDLAWGVPFVDGVLQRAKGRGLKVLLTFYQTPTWESGAGKLNVPPRDPARFAAVAGWAATRWRDRVDAWEIWNEPNTDDFFAGADPARYAQLLCATYPKVKAGDPGAPVVFGGLSYNDDAWLRRAYAARVRGCFDVLATHPYQGRSAAPPEAPDDGHPWWLTHTDEVRQAMVDNGDAAKPIWFTEIGWSTKSPPNPQPWDTSVSESTQAAYLIRSAAYIRSNYPFVKAMFWFRDTELTTGDLHEDGYGLLRPSLQPKPALRALCQAAGRTDCGAAGLSAAQQPPGPAIGALRHLLHPRPLATSSRKVGHRDRLELVRRQPRHPRW